MFDLTGRVAFVTGGNGGLGLAMAKGLAQAGASVAIAARNRDKTRGAVDALKADGAKVIGLGCDVADRSSVQQALDDTVDEFGGLDIVINNAGTSRRAPEPQDLSPEDWQTVIDTNLTGVHVVSTLAFPHLKKRGGGKIINIGSMMSIFGSPYASPYSASKGGVVQYTKSCAIAWAKHNVQVNAILPGWFHTDMTAAFIKMFPEREQAVAERTPVGRWGRPDEIAGTAVFLASNASDFVTGTAIPVDGGYSIQ